MRSRVKLIEKIEGEAKLHLGFGESGVESVEVEFFSGRDIEDILSSKPALDALVINPRVCGICGHAHLVATSKALESTYKDIKIPKNSEILREITLNLEIIQNHFKWIYLTILPLLGVKEKILKATTAFQLANRAIATVAGQYPHNSYSIVGGVVCRVTALELIKLKEYLNELIAIFQRDIVVDDVESLISSNDLDRLFEAEGAISIILKKLQDLEALELGKSHNRFIVFGENSYFNRGRVIESKIYEDVSEERVKEFMSSIGFAKSLLYDNNYYEVGAVARSLIVKVEIIEALYRLYGDSVVTRVVSRVLEIFSLLKSSLELTNKIELDAPFFIEPEIDISKITGVGVASVEAARGSLIHRVELEDGFIKNYDIITPTQWNLGNGVNGTLGVAQKAIIGAKDEHTAELIFKSFDVCSVCTTH